MAIVLYRRGIALTLAAVFVGTILASVFASVSPLPSDETFLNDADQSDQFFVEDLIQEFSPAPPPVFSVVHGLIGQPEALRLPPEETPQEAAAIRSVSARGPPFLPPVCLLRR